MNNSELGGPRTSWIDEILPPHLCIVCFITFLAIYQGKFGFGKFQQKLGLRSDPPPWLGQKPIFFRKSILMAPLISTNEQNHPGRTIYPRHPPTPPPPLCLLLLKHSCLTQITQKCFANKTLLEKFPHQCLQRKFLLLLVPSCCATINRDPEWLLWHWVKGQSWGGKFWNSW